MATFDSIQVTTSEGAIHLRFRLGGDVREQSRVMGWQVYDPDTGAFIQEGEWAEVHGSDVDLAVAVPAAPGPYRIQVAPVDDRKRFIAVDAVVTANESGVTEVALSSPRVETLATQRRQRFWQAIPKAFTIPVRSLWANRKLMRSMVARDIAARYQGSFFGAVWTFLNPLLLMATYFFVFGVVLRSRWAGDDSQSGYVLYFLAGMLPWLAFSEGVGRAPTIILEYRNFVSKLVFPLDTLPANLAIAGLVTEVFGMAIFLAGLLWARGAVPVTVLWLPVLLIPQVLLTVGIAWTLAATGVFMRDLSQVIGFLLTLGFFLTPICYPEASLPESATVLMQFNPIYILVSGYRAILLEGQAPLTAPVAWLWAGSGALAILGYGWFHRLRKSFADVI